MVLELLYSLFKFFDIFLNLTRSEGINTQKSQTNDSCEGSNCPFQKLWNYVETQPLLKAVKNEGIEKLSERLLLDKFIQTLR